MLRDGWLHTGDLGRFDADGALYIVGRAKDVIVDSGGNNVYIDEIEEAYGHSPYVKEMAVAGLKVAQGEQVAALVVPAYARGESRRAVEDRLREHFDKVGAGLSAHKRIRILRFTDTELPRTRTRKVKRAEVTAVLERMIQNQPGARDRGGDEIAPWLAHALEQVAGGATEITPATRLIEDLGLDSLALAELAEADRGQGRPRAERRAARQRQHGRRSAKAADRGTKSPATALLRALRAALYLRAAWRRSSVSASRRCAARCRPRSTDGSSRASWAAAIFPRIATCWSWPIIRATSTSVW